jgi:SNF2 family DNA or RNA helicase
MAIKFKAHPYQIYAINQILDKPKCALILDMGLGKTISTLSAINELMYNRFDITRVLVIAPLRVAETTWPEEISKWDSVKHLKYSIILGTAAERERALKADADIYLINRENTMWLIQKCIEAKKWPFDMLVIDESSSFKNHQSKRFKALRKVAAITKRVVLLTGTPSPNGLMDLWSQFYLLDQGQRLGRTITEYRNTFFNPGRRNQQVIFDYKPKPGAEEEIYRRISDIATSMKAKDYIQMPDRIDNSIKVKLPKAIQKQYDELERDLVLELESEEVVTAGSKAAVRNKLLQFANGAVYGEDNKVVHIHDLKLDALEEIIEVSQGQSIMVFYWFKHDLSRLLDRFAKLHPVVYETTEDKRRWDAGEIQLLFAHPASMGHGLNLQDGGNIIVWFGLTWNLELYLQAIARLYRQGQKKTVIVNHIIAEGTVDEDVLRSLEAKDVDEDKLIESIKARIKANARKN